jgi:putative intracellular protease/amidase
MARANLLEVSQSKLEEREMKRFLLWGGLGVVVLALAGFGGWILTLPSTPVAMAQPPIAEAEAAATIAALKPPKRERPVIAIIGVNEGTETTDYLMPYGILRRADIADVVAVATKPGPVTLYPALTVEPQATVADFDAKYPDGADYVIVPAMYRDDDPVVLAWLQAQSKKGAMVVGICAGAKVVAAAGLLDGKRATTHWFYIDEIRDEHPTLQYVSDRRLVVDQGVATTTGITASMPMMLTLIEAIAGRQKAESVASDLGLAEWDARHDSNAFKFTRPFALTAMGNTLAFWSRDDLGMELQPGVDEVSLALVADAWSRTYRSRAVIFAAGEGALESRNGIKILPDRIASGWASEDLVPSIAGKQPAVALDDTLKDIGTRYGSSTVNLVAMQLEYPR